MSYFFTNPQVKKWKNLFLISLLLNVILVVSIIVDNFEEKAEDELRQQKVIEEKEKQKRVEKELEKKGDTDKSPLPKAGAEIPVRLVVNDNFYSSFSNSDRIKELSEELNNDRLAEILSAHVARLLVWDMVLRKDVRNGDECVFLFRTIPEKEKRVRKDLPDEIEVTAVNYFSKKYNKLIEIYEFKPDGKTYRKYYYPSGKMIEKLIENGPMKSDSYIQITALIHDRRPKHEGIDYKAIVGTPVYSPVNGVVLRTNWKTRYNGYCIEIQVKNMPYTVKFLHLSDVNVKKGDRILTGDHIANSGNTGKTTAPHLHYQINRGRGGKVVDPFEFHKITHHFLKGSALKLFIKKREELKGKLTVWKQKIIE